MVTDTRGRTGLLHVWSGKSDYDPAMWAFDKGFWWQLLTAFVVIARSQQSQSLDAVPVSAFGDTPTTGLLRSLLSFENQLEREMLRSPWYFHRVAL